MKLLNKTLRAYIFFSIVILLISAPLFYFFTDRLFVHEADEVLYLHKAEFLNYNLRSLTLAGIKDWNRVSRDSRIEPNKPLINRDTLFNESLLDSLDNEEVPYRVLASPIVVDNKMMRFVTRVSLIESEALIFNIGRLFCMTLIALLTGLYFITKGMSSKLWRPFYATIEKLEQFQLDKNVMPLLSDTGIDEFNRLNNSVGQLLEKNLRIYKSQKEFIENAAHELQTPLALFQAKLDTLAQEMPMTDSLSTILLTLHESASRLNRINKNLLLLSKMENDQFKTMTPVGVTQTLAKQTDFLSGQVSEKQITLELLQIENVEATANATLLEIAISNLLLNALRHNHAGGSIQVTLAENKLIVSNTGQRSALNELRLFQRFANPASDGGAGLGLAIVKKICDLHGWRLQYWFSDDKHNFEITFLANQNLTSDQVTK